MPRPEPSATPFSRASGGSGSARPGWLGVDRKATTTRQDAARRGTSQPGPGPDPPGTLRPGPRRPRDAAPTRTGSAGGTAGPRPTPSYPTSSFRGRPTRLAEALPHSSQGRSEAAELRNAAKATEPMHPGIERPEPCGTRAQHTEHHVRVDTGGAATSPSPSGDPQSHQVASPRTPYSRSAKPQKPRKPPATGTPGRPAAEPPRRTGCPPGAMLPNGDLSRPLTTHL